MPATEALWSRKIGTLLVACASVAVASSFSRQAYAEPDVKDLSQIEAIYVTDPTSLWFEKWTERNLKAGDWLIRPDIKIKTGAELVAAVSANAEVIGLLPRGQLTRLETAGAPKITSAPTGLSVCAALSVADARPETTLGDFALNTDQIEILATPDTLAIAEALIDAHQFRSRMRLREVASALAYAELSSGKSRVAILPVLPQARLFVPEDDASFRVIEITEAAAEAVRSRGLDPQHFRTSILQNLPLISGLRTVCDEIVMITSANQVVTSTLTSAPASSLIDLFTGSDFEKRIRQALESFRSLWQQTEPNKG